MEIQPADRGLRKQTLVWLVLLTALGGAGLLALHGWLDHRRHPPYPAAGLLGLDLPGVFLILVAILCLLVIGLGILVWRMGAQVRAAARFPPPGQRVIRDTPILQGVAATRRGRLLQGLAVVLCLCALGLGIFTWRLLGLLLPAG
jgi:hypothetical protein